MSLSEKLLVGFWNMTAKKDNKRLAKKIPRTDIEEITDLYYKNDNEYYHMLDIYKPKGATEKLPVIIDIHGGGWIYGTKELNKIYCHYLAKEGFAVVNMNYHLFPTVTLPEPIQDIFSVFNYLLENQDTLNLDMKNVFLTGDSAGGHYTMLCQSILCDEELQTLYGVHSDIKFNAIGMICGAFDPTDFGKIKLPIAKCMVAMFFDKDKKYKNHKYFNSVNTYNAQFDKFPPMFFSTCYGDFIKKYSVKLHKLLNELNIEHTYFYAKRKGSKHFLPHVYNVMNPEWSESAIVNEMLINHFRDYLVK